MCDSGPQKKSKAEEKIASEWRRQANRVGNTTKRTPPKTEITVLDDSG